MPASDVDSSAPEAGLLGLAAGALEAVARAAASSGDPDRRPAFRAAIAEAALALGVSLTASQADTQTRHHHGETTGRILEAGWDLPTQADDRRFRALLALEAAVDERLRRAGLGWVDGNEVGGGRYVLFVETDSRSAARAVITELASEAHLDVPTFATDRDGA